VRTLYACVGEHETELSFEPNAIITSGGRGGGWMGGLVDWWIGGG
jgi:hypothetical protein